MFVKQSAELGAGFYTPGMEKVRTLDLGYFDGWEKATVVETFMSWVETEIKHFRYKIFSTKLFNSRLILLLTVDPSLFCSGVSWCTRGLCTWSRSSKKQCQPVAPCTATPSASSLVHSSSRSSASQWVPYEDTQWKLITAEHQYYICFYIYSFI